MFETSPITIITANDGRFLPVILTERPSYAESLLPVNCTSVPYERIIEGNEGIRVEVMTNERGSPIIAITRINRDGETLCTDGTQGGITCHHHNQLFVFEQHQFGFFNFDIGVEAHLMGHTVSLSCVGLDNSVHELIETKNTGWSY